MTRTITSQTDSDKTYTLTIDETGHAASCTCPSYLIQVQYQGKRCTCKHQDLFHQEVIRARKFATLFKRYDCRANGDEATRRCYYELSIGA